ncbi:MAG: TolC family protein [Bacteroidota bacterium]
MKINTRLTLFLIITLLFTHSSRAQNWNLKQCVDTALKNNTSVQLSANTIDLNNISLRQSKDNLFPNLNASAGETFSPVLISDGNQTDNSWSNNLSLNSSFTIFNGFQNRNTVKQNQIDYDASKYDLESIKNEIILNVIEAYLQVLYNEEQLKNAKNTVDASLSQLENAKNFVSVGKKTESDLLQIKSQLASDNLSLANAMGQLKSAKLNLQQIMNIPASELFEIDYPRYTLPLMKDSVRIDEIYKMALAKQPVIKSYQLKTESAKYGIEIAKGGLLPRLSFNTSVLTSYSSLAKLSTLDYQNSIQEIGYLQSNPAEMVMGNVSNPVYTYSNYSYGKQFKDNFGLSFSLSLSVPIFNNHNTKNNISIQKINFRNALLNEQNIQSDLRKKIEQSCIDVENSYSKFIAAGEQVNASAASYQNSITKYYNGMMSLSDLFLDKNKNTKAQSELIQAKYQLIYDLKILDYYKGIPITL